MEAPVGLSVGATNLTAVAVGRTSVTRPTRVGAAGQELSDLADRVGDPVGILASDGSSHRPEALLVEALRTMVHSVGGAPQLAVTHPVHWRPPAIDALGAALAAEPELAGAALIDDAHAAATALADSPGLPARGVILVCDFGGSGTSITFVDAANGYRPVGPAVRHLELSGTLIDQALLRRVLADLPETAAGATGTSALGSLSRLRDQCRAAKERLSDVVATSLDIDLPSHRTAVRLTRDELDAQLRAPLAEFMTVLQDAMRRNGIRPADLTAVASVGGGARIPVITTTLSEHLGFPVVTPAYPGLAAAIGGGLLAAARAHDGVTALLPAAPVFATPAAPTSGVPQLAWSQDTDSIAEPAPYAEPVHDPRPELRFADDEVSDSGPAVLVPWYRRPHVILGLGAAVVLAAAVAAVILVLRADETPSPAIDSTTTPATSEPPAPVQSPTPQAPAPAPTRTVTQQPPATRAPTVAPPPATQAPAPVTEAPPPVTEAPPPTTETPPPETTPPLIPTIPTIPPIPTIPGLPPFIPQPGELVSP